MNKGLGRIYAPDERDWLLAAVAVEPVAEPITRRRPFYHTGSTLDQGPHPTCVGHAWRQWLSSARLMTRSGPGAVEIYQAAQKADEWDGEGYAGTSVRAGAKVLQAGGHIKSYLWAYDVESMREWIVSGMGTIVLGTNWYRGMMQPDQRGYIVPGGSSVGGHAYLCVGYSPGRAAFRIINSWSSQWGENGRAWIDQQDMAGLLAQQGEACMAVERRAV